MTRLRQRMNVTRDGEPTPSSSRTQPGFTGEMC
jgi:hypothetical protein